MNELGADSRGRHGVDYSGEKLRCPILKTPDISDKPDIRVSILTKTVGRCSNRHSGFLSGFKMQPDKTDKKT